MDASIVASFCIVSRDDPGISGTPQGFTEMVQGKPRDAQDPQGAPGVPQMQKVRQLSQTCLVYEMSLTMQQETPIRNDWGLGWEVRRGERQSGKTLEKTGEEWWKRGGVGVELGLYMLVRLWSVHACTLARADLGVSA